MIHVRTGRRSDSVPISEGCRERFSGRERTSDQSRSYNWSLTGPTGTGIARVQANWARGRRDQLRLAAPSCVPFTYWTRSGQAGYGRMRIWSTPSRLPGLLRRRRPIRFPRPLVRYVGRMLRPENWTRPAGASPARVIAGAPGSRPRFVAERRRAERGVKSLFGGSKRAGRSATRHESCSLVTRTTKEPSRSCHGEGSIRPTGDPDMPLVESFRGTGSGTYARLGSGQERPVLPASSAKTARISRW
jgi:hypothetical protein